MKGRLRITEALMTLILMVVFCGTGLCIMWKKYDYAMLLWMATSLALVLDVWLLFSEHTGRVIDLRGSMEKERGQKNYGASYGEEMFHDGYSMNQGDQFHEGVGNMRVYQRGEQINFVDENDD